MHNEELGLVKKEIEFIYNSLSEDKQLLLDVRLRNMPKIPYFPSFTRTLEDLKSFKAKDWITICKTICYAVQGMLKMQANIISKYYFRFNSYQYV